MAALMLKELLKVYSKEQLIRLTQLDPEAVIIINAETSRQILYEIQNKC